MYDRLDFHFSFDQHGRRQRAHPGVGVRVIQDVYRIGFRGLDAPALPQEDFCVPTLGRGDLDTRDEGALCDLSSPDGALAERHLRLNGRIV